METKTKTLQLVFLNEKGKRASLNLPDAAAQLVATTVEQAMDTIASANIFAKEGVDTYRVPQSASYIERIVTSLFDHAAAKSNRSAAAGGSGTDR